MDEAYFTKRPSRNWSRPTNVLEERNLREKIGNLPVLKNALRSERARGRDQFQILRVHDAVAMEDDSGFRAWKMAKTTPPSRTSEVMPGGQLGHQIGIQIIQNVPHEHGVEGVFRILQSGVQKSLRARCRRHLGAVRIGSKLSSPLLVGIQEISSRSSTNRRCKP